MNWLWRTGFSVLLLSLMGCAQNTLLGNHQPLSQCKMICAQHLASCKKNCTNNCPTCSAISSITSAENFIKYVHEQEVEGGYVTRGLNSYRDPLQCRKVTCNCTSDFTTCIQGCTGMIQKQLRSVPYCT